MNNKTFDFIDMICAFFIGFDFVVIVSGLVTGKYPSVIVSSFGLILISLWLFIKKISDWK